MRIRQSSDLMSGLLFTGAAIVGIALSSRLEFGTPARMSAGFFPMVLSVLLLLLGAIVLLRSLLARTAEIDDVDPRPLVAILAGVVIFSLTVERLGFVVAGVALILVGRLAMRPFKPLEVGILAAALVGVSAAIFLWGLKLPLRLLPV